MRKSITVIVCNLFFFCCMAEAGFPSGKYEISEEGRKNAEFLQESAMFYYYFKKKNTEAAVKYFLTILEKKPHSEYLIYWGIRLYDDGVFPEDKFIETAKRHPESSMMCGAFAESLEKKKKKQDAFEIIEKSFSYYLDPPSEKEEPRGKNPEIFPSGFSLMISTYLSFIEQDKAYQKGDLMLEKIFRYYPFRKLDDRILMDLLQYSILAENSGKSSARSERTALYLKTLKEKIQSPNSFHHEIQGRFLLLLMERKESVLAENILTESLLTAPYSMETYRNLFLSYMVKEQKQNMIRALAHEIVVTSMKEKRLPGNRLALLLSIAFDAGNELEIKTHLGRVERMGFLNDELCHKAVSYYLKKKDFSKAKYYCSKIKNPTTRNFVTAVIFSGERKHKQALAIYLRLEQASPKNVYFKMLAAESAKKAGELEIEKQFLNEMILKNKNNSEFQNFVGYTWAERGINLDQAEQYIKSALSAKPQNGAYLDSMAWVLYKKKDFRRAKEYILKALDHTPDEDARGVLLDHAGDIFAALGEKKAALKYWQKAVQTGSGELDISSVMKKLPQPVSVQN